MSKTALIVEDEIFVALDLERILLDAGYDVAAIAADRESALLAAPDCGFAFVDVNLRDGPTGPDIARRIAAEKGIDLSGITGTGPRGRIVKADVEGAKPGAAKPAAVSAAAPTAAPTAGPAAQAPKAPSADTILKMYADRETTEMPLDGMRRTVAARLS